MDISGLIPVPQIVAGYSPKVRNMYYMVMGSLQKHYGENPIVVINADGGVNREQTVAYIQSLEEGFEPADEDIYYDEAGTAYQLIKVGVDAQSIYDADPLESTRALAQNGMGRGRINWKNIPLEVKQVAYYAVTQTREIDPSNEAHLTWLRDHIKVGVNRLVFQGQAPKALQAYNEALRSGTLPQLRVMLGRSARRREVMPRRRSTTPRDLAGIGREADL
jgi:hypothetical protein